MGMNELHQRAYFRAAYLYATIVTRSRLSYCYWIQVVTGSICYCTPIVPTLPFNSRGRLQLPLPRSLDQHPISQTPFKLSWFTGNWLQYFQHTTKYLKCRYIKMNKHSKVQLIFFIWLQSSVLLIYLSFTLVSSTKHLDTWRQKQRNAGDKKPTKAGEGNFSVFCILQWAAEPWVIEYVFLDN